MRSPAPARQRRCRLLRTGVVRAPPHPPQHTAREHTRPQVLDIPRTLEFLETQGVPVAGYETDELPAFFTRRSGVRAPCRVDTPEQ